MPRTLQQQREARAQKRRDGVCFDCSMKALSDGSRCAGCLDKQSARDKARRAAGVTGPTLATANVLMRVTPEDKAHWQAMARAEGVSLTRCLTDIITTHYPLPPLTRGEST